MFIILLSTFLCIGYFPLQKGKLFSVHLSLCQGLSWLFYILFFLPKEYSLIFSFFLSFHSANISRHLFSEDTVLGLEGQADGPVLVLSLLSHGRRQMKLRQCGQACWGKGWHKKREEKLLWFMPFGRNSWKKVYLKWLEEENQMDNPSSHWGLARSGAGPM